MSRGGELSEVKMRIIMIRFFRKDIPNSYAICKNSIASIARGPVSHNNKPCSYRFVLGWHLAE